LEASHVVGNGVSQRKELFCLILEQRVVSAEIGAGHVPMEAFGSRI
jgi:hypothetical protein